jgi:hypothetical protein
MTEIFFGCVAGEPLPKCECYLKQPTPAGALGSCCSFCVREIVLQVVGWWSNAPNAQH